MERSCINDASSSKSTIAEQPQKRQIPFEASTLLAEIRKLTSVDTDTVRLSDLMVHLAANFHNFLENF